jgi:hypothetical protein
MIQQLNALLEELKSRARRDGVANVLVNGFGLPWTGDGFGGSFNRVRDLADIVHMDADTGKPRKKHPRLARNILHQTHPGWITRSPDRRGQALIAPTGRRDTPFLH